jgi:hypothetical protein
MLALAPWDIGDWIWVRETFCEFEGAPNGFAYRSDMTGGMDGLLEGCWKPSIHMPREASRITLEITDIRAERLDDISEADAMAEGVPWRDVAGLAGHTSRKLFKTLWESIYGEESWAENPWVWVVVFKRLEGPCRT